jgi:tetratricopeptide (TPR) repeat protein
LDPNYADGHLWYALYLSSVGRYDDALAEVLEAKELAPLAPYVDLGVGAVHYFGTRYEEALLAHRQAAELDSTFVNAKVWLGLTLAALERNDEALVELKGAVALTNRHPLALWPLGYAYARMGRRDDAREILQILVARSQQEFIQAYGIAAILFALGDLEEGLNWTERAYEAREYTMSDFANGPVQQQLSDHPRFRRILERMDLTTRRPRLLTVSAAP